MPKYRVTNTTTTITREVWELDAATEDEARAIVAGSQGNGRPLQLVEGSGVEEATTHVITVEPLTVMPPDDLGLAYLFALLKLAVRSEKLVKAVQPSCLVNDGVGYKLFGSSELLLLKAAEVAQDVDGIVNYKIGEALFRVIYDGPYTADNAAEIVNDTNEEGEQVQALLNQELGL